ncbi:hypothetical protein EXA14_19600 [Vibrio cincinnatiensis]|nr:hypothetical protein [Vibrio cincinnatiensis]
MNKVIETIQAHRSIRAFKEQPISQEQLNSIIASGIAASSSSLIQAISIIRVTDKEKRAQLAKLAGHQPYVESAAEFLVFCIDYQRHHSINNEVKPEYMELMRISVIANACFGLFRTP